MGRQRIYLECVTEVHNKFYEMTENEDGTFHARYGSIGAPGTLASYPMNKWNAKLKEKLRKGYVQVFAKILPDGPASQAGADTARQVQQNVIDKVNQTGTKYGLTGNSKVIYLPKPVTVYQIVAKKDFIAGDGAEIPAGTLGGWIEQPGNLTQENNCWAGPDTVIAELAQIRDNAVLRGSAIVYNTAVISGSAVVKDESRVYGSAHVKDNSMVYGAAKIHGNATICEKAWVCADVSGTVRIKAWVEGGIYTEDEQIITDRLRA